MDSEAGSNVEGLRMEGLGHGREDVDDRDDVDDAGDLFIRDASGNVRRCYVATDVTESQGSSAR